MMISTGMQAALNVNMISFNRPPYMLVFPCLCLLLQEVMHHDAAHAETLGIYHYFWILQDLRKNLFLSDPSPIIGNACH